MTSPRAAEDCIAHKRGARSSSSWSDGGAQFCRQRAERYDSHLALSSQLGVESAPLPLSEKQREAAGQHYAHTPLAPKVLGGHDLAGAGGWRRPFAADWLSHVSATDSPQPQRQSNLWLGVVAAALQGLQAAGDPQPFPQVHYGLQM